ncbi:YcxB family protein [Acinetobacter nectaris]|uniref:YcxB family protein n=1 Tax=Acinetobacter nectaris TaxID=1219382 RepID=UPI001F470BA7|nr:YcxB family protein [Acinetobacter nectaris]MCF9034541.1 YcxB family protein [Acinetobacter nectaris]
MTTQKPALSLQYVLNLEESQDGFKLITLGKKQFTQFITPLISIGLIVFGFYVGFNGAGRYYVGLGALFLFIQLAVRYWLLPMIFKRQFVRYQLGKNEQKLALYQDYAVMSSNGRDREFSYKEVKHFAQGKLTYVIELKTRAVLIIPKRALDTNDQALFENTFNKLRG